MKCYKLLVIIPALFLMSCAPSLQLSEMTPSLNKSEFISTDQSLTIAEVTGKVETDVLGFPMIHIKSEDLKEAIVKTFVTSGIFKEVLIERKGDYQLSAKIISQMMEGVYSNTLPLLIRYKFVDNKDGEILWTENIFSQKSLSVIDEPLGVKRGSRIREMAVNDNLNQLVRKVQGIISKEIANKKSEVAE